MSVVSSQCYKTKQPEFQSVTVTVTTFRFTAPARGREQYVKAERVIRYILTLEDQREESKADMAD